MACSGGRLKHVATPEAYSLHPSDGRTVLLDENLDFMKIILLGMVNV